MFRNAALETNVLTGKINENFPVGSFLLSKRVRPLVWAFYCFVRAADDIADSPVLDSPTKLAKLKEMEQALQEGERPFPTEEWTRLAWHLTQILQHSGFTLDQPRIFLLSCYRAVFHEDSKNWADLLDSCRLSAHPVGRFLLGIHHETTPEALRASDALCTALQLLDHLQDCHKDFTVLNRVYIPADLLAAEGLDRTFLGKRRAPPGLLRVFDHILDTVEYLLREACNNLKDAIVCRRLRMEAAVIVSLSFRLLHRLRQKDLLAHSYGLHNFDWLLATIMTFKIYKGNPK